MGHGLRARSLGGDGHSCTEVSLLFDMSCFCDRYSRYRMMLSFNICLPVGLRCMPSPSHMCCGPIALWSTKSKPSCRQSVCSILFVSCRQLFNFLFSKQNRPEIAAFTPCFLHFRPIFMILFAISSAPCW